jgi:hypothetical protein
MYFSSNGVRLTTARNQDVPRLPWLLTNHPQEVLVFDMWLHKSVPLIDLAAAPFFVVDEDKHFVLCGNDAKTGQPALLRIVDTEIRTLVLQYRNHKYKEWGDSPDSNCLMVPADTLFSCRLTATATGIHT